MITKLAKSTACFFSANSLIKKEDEEVYVYGMELLLSTVFNLVIAVLIALISDTVIPCIIQFAAFVTLRVKAGGYHAETHWGCILIFALIQSLFVLTVKTINTEIMFVSIPVMLIISSIIILKYAPLEHPNKPLSDKKKKKLRKQALFLLVFWELFSIAFVVFERVSIGFYLSMGIFILGISIVAEKIKQGACVASEKI